MVVMSFSGVTRYGDALRRDARRSLRFAGLCSTIGLMLPHSTFGRNRLIDLGRSRRGRYASTVLQPVRTDEGGVGLATQSGGLTTIEDQLREWFAIDDDYAAAMMMTDFQTYLPGDILTKVDRTSMAVSLEARVPLLDFDLVDFAMAIPGHLRVTPTESKRLFRRAIRGLVPDSVLARPKRGFEVPLGRWFRGPLRHRIEQLRTSCSSIESFVDRAAVKRLIGEHTVGRRDHSGQLWRLIVLDYWLAALRSGSLGRPPVMPSAPIAAPRAVDLP